MESLWPDFRYALRGLRNQPGFATLAVLTLALGIGATTTMFSVIYNVLFNAFPYHEAERVVAFQVRDAERPQNTGRNMFQTPEFLDYVEQSTVFTDVIAGSFDQVIFTRESGTELLNAGLVTGNNFSFLGVPALVGRTLSPADGRPNAPPVCVLSHKMWRKYFNEDVGIIGQSLVLDNISTTVVGVMPERFTKLNADVYRPIVLDRADAAINERFFMFQAKLKPGIEIPQAEAELKILAERFAKVYPRNYPPKFFVKLVSWVDNILGPFRKTLYTLAAAVGLLLLIACSNVANMLLARAAAREKEMAVRASLGAGRARLISQLLAESLVLALIATVVGCLFAQFGVKALANAIPDGAIPKEARITLNWPVLVFSVGVAGLTALLFGLVPALQTARKDIVEPLKDARKGGGGGFRGGKLRKALVVFEVAVSLVLLVGSGLLIRSFMKLTTVDLGFEPEKILFARLPFPRGQYETAGKKQQFFRELLPRLEKLPGVAAVTHACAVPPFGGIRSEIAIPGRPLTTERQDTIIEFVSEGYFPTFNLRLLRGRLLSEVEMADARKVIVVNQAFVARFFAPEDNPLGRTVRFKLFEPPGSRHIPNPDFEIVGVVADLKNSGIENSPAPQAYTPFGITGAYERGVLLRTTGNPLALVNAVRREIWAVDRNIAITDTDSIGNFLRQFSYASPRFSLLVLGVFAGVGLVLVVLGVYSVMAYTVTQQTHEIGIRMALGATRPDVLRMVLSMGGRMIALGAVVGTLASIGLTLLLRQQLGGTEWTNDPATIAVVVGFVAIAGLAACYFPAFRATRVDPMVALRHE